MKRLAARRTSLVLSHSSFSLIFSPSFSPGASIPSGDHLIPVFISFSRSGPEVVIAAPRTHGDERVYLPHHLRLSLRTPPKKSFPSRLKMASPSRNIFLVRCSFHTSPLLYGQLELELGACLHQSPIVRRAFVARRACSTPSS